MQLASPAVVRVRGEGQSVGAFSLVGDSCPKLAVVGVLIAEETAPTQIPEMSGLRRHQRPEHVHIEVAGRRVGIAADLPARAGEPVPVRVAPLAHCLMRVADLGDRAGVGRDGDEPARKR